MARTLLLGAHCDDLAFSLGGALFDGYFGSLLPVTIYTVSNYSRRRPPSAVAEISKRRKEEDRRFFRRIPAAAPPLWLDRFDAPLRHGIEPAHTRLICIPVDAEAASLAAAIIGFSPACERVVAPLALGGHIDHRVVAAAAVRLCGRELFFYEDLPYAGEMPPEEILTAVESLAAELGGKLQPLFLPSCSIPAARQWAVRCYSSQIGPEDLDLLLSHPRRLGAGGTPAERLWRYSPKAGKV